MRLFKVVNLNKQKVEWWLPGPGRIGKGEVAIQPEQRVSVLQDEKVLEISCTTNGHTVNKNLLQG